MMKQKLRGFIKKTEQMVLMKDKRGSDDQEEKL
jgi:hypothetical protein